MSSCRPFEPKTPLKNAFLQTVLASSRLRTLGKNQVAAETRELILVTSDGVRLTAHYSPQINDRSRGLVIFLNGWQGDATSAYILATAKTLYNQKYAILRLEYRDHGNNHHLNQGLFYATLLEEVFECVEQAAQIESPRPAFLAGFSLGGNFALRIAKNCRNHPIKNLRHIVSISPVLDPDKSTDAIARNKIINAYFLKKWKRSLLKKQTLFPDVYDFNCILRKNDIREMTEMLIATYTHYEDARRYFAAYAIRDDDLTEIPIPVTIIAAKDDPIIPAEDFHSLNITAPSRLFIHDHGGHNGFFETLRLTTWYEMEMIELFNRLT